MKMGEAHVELHCDVIRKKTFGDYAERFIVVSGCIAFFSGMMVFSLWLWVLFIRWAVS